ncbi:hypothetical protein EBN88_00410 [Streptomyces triticirhizae]|uniref:Uncharacterized protein n=2 Tax=Streptomyces triticirhizae TaxID=2483353 RepID=A0A3M2MB56_9ACTN|nr:hypothetical protein EBN88_00410 [Streptomyces triticirhizae]
MAVLVPVLTAWWVRDATRRASNEAAAVGRRQADTAVEIARRQEETERAQRSQEIRRAACEAFLSAADRLAHEVDRLPQVTDDLREALLSEATVEVHKSWAALELLGIDELSEQARGLLTHCQRMERVALDRAVLHHASARLEEKLCPGNSEWCEDPVHGSAIHAWICLTEWGHIEEDEREQHLEELEFSLRESEALTNAQIQRVLAVTTRPFAWSDMVVTWHADPLKTGFKAAREEFVRAAVSN